MTLFDREENWAKRLKKWFAGRGGGQFSHSSLSARSRYPETVFLADREVKKIKEKD